jgi:hypothetical protein
MLGLGSPAASISRIPASIISPGYPQASSSKALSSSGSSLAKNSRISADADISIETKDGGSDLTPPVASVTNKQMVECGDFLNQSNLSSNKRHAPDNSIEACDGTEVEGSPKAKKVIRLS